MKTTGIIITIILALILAVYLYFKIRPYTMRYDTTILLTGGLGSGKTCNGVKKVEVCIQLKRLIHYYIPNLKIKIINKIRKLKNKIRQKRYLKAIKKGMKPEDAYKILKEKLDPLPYREKPLVYSNLPIHFRKHIFGFKREWSKKLKIEHLLLLKKMNEYSVVMMDEMPQFVSQFDWDEPLVQKQLNEFITFFRHYISGNLIITAQSEDEIECHFRRKLNQGIWCFDFHVWPCRFIPIFYTCRMCDYIISENIQTVSTTYIEDNTRLYFGILPRKTYDSRCYKPRYKNVERFADKKTIKPARWTELTTSEVLRFKPYNSPLDTNATKKEILDLTAAAERIQRRNKDEIK